ncbi:unnamed protein product, partial [Ectocarpus sp. 12 AP-2014]
GRGRGETKGRSVSTAGRKSDRGGGADIASPHRRRCPLPRSTEAASAAVAATSMGSGHPCSKNRAIMMADNDFSDGIHIHGWLPTALFSTCSEASLRAIPPELLLPDDRSFPDDTLLHNKHLKLLGSFVRHADRQTAMTIQGPAKTG